VKNTNWQEANQPAIEERGRGVEHRTTGAFQAAQSDILPTPKTGNTGCFKSNTREESNEQPKLDIDTINCIDARRDSDTRQHFLFLLRKMGIQSDRGINCYSKSDIIDLEECVMATWQPP